jgi:hypothetical protein
LVLRTVNSSMPKILLFLLSIVSQSLLAANWYVDSAAPSGGNGKSWSTAWKTVQAVSGVAATDTVYISGGIAGASKTYSLVGGWTPPSATYQTGQETGHNGLVVFDGGSQAYLLTPASNVTFSGFVTGDTGKHMKFQGNWDARIYISGSTITRLHITYVTDSGCNRFLYLANSSRVTGLEIDHCFIHKGYSGSANSLDDVFYLGGDGGGAKYHDNTIEMTCASTISPYGADGWKWGWGYRIYNNHIRVLLDANYPGTTDQQHADIVQTAGSDIEIYNNWIENIGESFFFHCHGGTTSGNFSHIWIYNNVITQSFPANIAQVARGLDFEPQDSQGMSTFADVLVANNVWSGITTIFVMRFHNAAKWTNCRVANNLYLNCNDSSSSSWDDVARAQIQVDHNATAQANWFADPAKYDFHPASGSPAIGAGAILTQFTTDAEGKPRTAPWTQGPYVTALPPAPTPTPTPTPPAIAVSDGTVLPVGFGTYPVSVTSGGQYTLVASVQAPDEGKNSIYVDFDSDPVNDDTRASDLPVNTAWADQRLAWRGNSTSSDLSQAEFNPKIWTLPLGAHTLFVRQREPASIRSVTFRLATPSPTPTPAPTPSPSASPTPTPTPAPTPSPSASPTPTYEQWIKEHSDADAQWIREHPQTPDAKGRGE